MFAMLSESWHLNGLGHDILLIAVGVGCGILGRDRLQRQLNKQKAKVENELHDTRNFLQAALDNLPVAVFIKNAEAEKFGEFILWNKASERMFGISSEKAIGKTDYDFFPIDQANFFTQKDREVFLSNSVIDIEEPIDSHTLGKRTLHTVKVPIYDRDRLPKYLLCISEDITEWRHTEEELGKSQRFIQSIADATPGVLYLYDLIEQRYIYINRRIIETLGYSSQEITAMGDNLLPSLMLPNDFNKYLEGLQILDTARDGESVEFEYRMRHKNGEWRWLLSRDSVFNRTADGKARQIVGTAIDISDRKNAELAIQRMAIELETRVEERTTELADINEQLKRSQQMLQLVLDAFPQRIFWKDKNFNYLGCNRIFAQDAGLRSSDQIVGKNDFELAWEKSAYLYRADDAEVIATNTAKIGFEEPQVRKDGSKAWLRTTKIPLQNELGEVFGVLGSYEDISDRKQVEEALKQSETQFKALVANIPGAVYRTIGRDWTVSYLSDDIETITGYPASDFIQNRVRSLIGIVHPDDAAMAVQAIDTALAEGDRTFTIEYRLIASDGSTKWILDKGQGIFDEDGNYLYEDGILFDISEAKRIEIARKQVEEALKQSETQFRALVANIPGAVYRAIDKNWTISFVSDEIETITGYPASDFIQNRVRSLTSLIHPDDAEMVRQMIDKASVINNHAFTIEYRLVTSDDSIKWVLDKGQIILDEDGNYLYEDGILFDITEAKRIEIERERAEQALWQSRELLKLTIENTPIGIATIDLDGRFLTVNHALCQIFGYSDTELLGMTFIDITHPDSLKQSTEVVKKLLSQGGQSFEIEKNYLRKDGTVINAISRGGLISDTDGKPLQIIVIVEDISDRKRNEDNLIASLKEKDVLLKEVHHRVKNNLQVISSIFSLQSQYITDPEILLVLSESQNRIGSMALIHEKLYQSHSLAEVSLCEYIKDIARNLFATYGVSSKRISLRISDCDVYLNIDTAIPCGLIVNELVSNSLKHAFPNRNSGEIHIVASVGGDRQICLGVQDNGVGLPEGLDVKKVSSLGLTLVDALVYQLKGDLVLFNHDGAAFQITFPQNI